MIYMNKNKNKEKTNPLKTPDSYEDQAEASAEIAIGPMVATAVMSAV